jgi:hypothetical protein
MRLGISFGHRHAASFSTPREMGLYLNFRQSKDASQLTRRIYNRCYSCDLKEFFPVA